MRWGRPLQVLLAAALIVGCGGAAPASAPSGGPLSADQLKGRTLVYADYGGALTAADQKWFGDPFAKQFGVDFKFLNVPSPPTELGLQEKSGAIQMDIIGAANYTNYKNGDLATLPSWLINNAKQQVTSPEYVTDHWIGGFGNTANIIACNPALIQRCPTNAKEFWDVKNFPGPRALLGTQPPDAALLFALMADGVAHDKLYPMDIPRAIKKLKEIKPYVSVWPTSGGQMQQVLVDKEVGIEYGWNGRLYTVQQQNIPDLKLFWNDSSVSSPTGGGIGVAKGAPNAEVAFAFLNWWVQQTDLQVGWVQQITYPAPNKKVDAQLPPKVLAALPFAPTHAKEVLIDAKWTFENQTAEKAAFQQFLTGSG